MPHLLVLLVAGAGLYVGYKWFVRESKRVSGDLKRANEDLKRQASGNTTTKDLGKLKLDPKTGEYRPDRDSPPS